MKVKQEHTCVYPLDVEVAHLNEHSVMKPSSYQSLFARLAEMHLADYQADFNETRKYGYAWALISISIEMVRPIDSCLRLYAGTWYSGRKGPYFRRELIFRNEAGEVMFQGSTHSVLLDVEKRSVYRKKEMPITMSEPYEEYTVASEPTFRENRDYIDVELREVRNSHLDCLGHVNNCRYGDFAYDAMDEEEKSRLSCLSRMDLYFYSELRLGDTFTIQKSKDADRTYFRGIKSSGETAFHIIFRFS